MKGYSKFLSVLIITILLLSRSFVFAQEITPTETPTETSPESPTPITEITITPTPTDDPTIDELTDTNEYTASNSASTGTNGENIDPQDVTNIIASHSATVDITIDNNNDADILKNIDTMNNTGSNTTSANIDIFNTLVIKTGDANDVENHSNIVNTNIVGEYIIPAILNFFGGEDANSYDYSQIQPCVNKQADPILSPDIQLSEAEGNKINQTDIFQREDSLGINNNNNANVVNNISVDALTGSNQSLDNIARTGIDTGNATIDVNLFNMLNTNITGECGFFGVF